MMERHHPMPFGARIEPGGVRFRLWAPDAPPALYVHGRGEFALERDAEGWAEAFVQGIGAGARYGYRVNGLTLPDPASRRQAEGVHGLSEVIDPSAYSWSDGGWAGRAWEEAVIYELHVGTFTPEGTFAAAIGRLDDLVQLGITAIELMPVAQFPGERGWGYDGVLLFAPHAAYGRPEDLKALVEAAHMRGLMVFLDVVYNHFGPEGNYLHSYAKRFFTDRHHTPWGQAVNYDGAHAGPVRDFVIHNALYWLDEFHFDGLRLDAVHAIIDDSAESVLEELARRVRASLPGRKVHLVLENDDNSAHLLGPKLFDAQWNDDIHHAFHRTLTGESGGYYTDYGPEPVAHLARCLAEGFAYQGEPSEHRNGARRGEASAHLPPTAFVAFLQNHDQIGNRALGERIDHLAQEAAVRAVTSLLLLSPQIPLLFQGEEWGATSPFLYFCDLGPDLADAVREGRRREFPDFQAEDIPDPLDPATFARSKLDWGERQGIPHGKRRQMVSDLLDVRRREIVPRLIGPRLIGMTGAEHASCTTLAPRAFRAEWELADGSLLAVIANLSPVPLPGIVPSDGRLLYSTYGGIGALPAWGVDWYLVEGGLV